MQKPFAGFDIETTDFEQEPVGITCLSFYKVDTQEYIPFWADGERMTETQVNAIVDTLIEVSVTHQIVTWNGLGFDFKTIAENSSNPETVSKIARKHIDMMYHFFCLRGFMLKLEAVSQHLKHNGKQLVKLPGMTGKLAPAMWSSSSTPQQLIELGASEGWANSSTIVRRSIVVEYVKNDAFITGLTADIVLKNKGWEWITRRGTVGKQKFDQWLTVAEASELPEPDTSWMSEPISRDKFSGWLPKIGQMSLL